MVQVKLGPDKEVFTIHKNLLCNTATYFKTALNGSFKEAQEQSIEMPEDDPTMFECFQVWIYTGSIVGANETENDVETLTLVKIYTFAERLNIIDLQNVAMHLLIDRVLDRRELPTEQIPFMYEHTCENSALRRMIVDISAHCGTLDRPGWFEESKRPMYPNDFLCDLILRLYHSKKNNQTPFEFVRSSYLVKAPVDPAQSGTKEKSRI